MRLFLGFYNYYQHFIAMWLKNIKPFIRLTKKNNNILGEYLNEFIIAYLNNIIIYSNSKEEYF